MCTSDCTQEDGTNELHCMTRDTSRFNQSMQLLYTAECSKIVLLEYLSNLEFQCCSSPCYVVY